MNIKNLGEIKAIAFDIDGTLYAPKELTKRAMFNYITHCIFYLKYGLVRHEMHGMPALKDFRFIQAQKMASKLKCSPQEAEDKLERIVYQGLRDYFKTIPCFKDVPEAFKAFKEAGFKLALLSDFPPEQKGNVWGVRDYCDVVLGTEALGCLKPDPYSFLELSRMLDVKPENILYVGNSPKYDIRGAHNAGMKTAFLLPFWRRMLNKPLKDADICFRNYRQLMKIVLG